MTHKEYMKEWRSRKTKSHSGNVVIEKAARKRFWSLVKKNDHSCWGWNGTHDNNGYGYMYVSDFRGSVCAHRISWILANGPIPSGMFVCHSCDNPSCTNPSHLFLGTASDNLKDAHSKGRIKTAHQWGEDNHMTRLTARDVIKIRELRGQKTQAEIAEQFGISGSSVCRIQKRIDWRRLI